MVAVSSASDPATNGHCGVFIPADYKKPALKFCDPYDGVITCKGYGEFCKKLSYPICKKIKSEPPFNAALLLHLSAYMCMCCFSILRSGQHSGVFSPILGPEPLGWW